MQVAPCVGGVSGLHCSSGWHSRVRSSPFSASREHDSGVRCVEQVRDRADVLVLGHVLPGLAAARGVALDRLCDAVCGTASNSCARSRSATSRARGISATLPTSSAGPSSASCSRSGYRRKLGVLTWPRLVARVMPFDSFARHGRTTRPGARRTQPHGLPAHLAHHRVRILRAGLLLCSRSASASAIWCPTLTVQRPPGRLHRVRRACAARVVGDERCDLRLDVQHLLEAEVRQDLRRGAVDAARAARRRLGRDHLGARPRHASTPLRFSS